MKLKMMTGLCGPKFSLSRGDEHEFDEDEAVRLVSAGFATTTTAKDAEIVAKAIADRNVEAQAEAEAAAAKAKVEAAPKDGAGKAAAAKAQGK